MLTVIAYVGLLASVLIGTIAVYLTLVKVKLI
jgi:hypothetical protein